MKIFKKENTRKDFGFLFEYFLEKNVLNNYFSDEACYSKCMNIVEEYCKEHYGISWKPLEELFEDSCFTNSIKCKELIEYLVNGLSYIPMNNLSWKNSNGVENVNFLLDHIFEHPDLPYYYILHNNQDSTYILIDKETGDYLPFKLKAILPSLEPNIINGQFDELNLDSADFFRISFDTSQPKDVSLYNINKVKDLINIPEEYKSSIEISIYSSIQPVESNVPITIIPLVDSLDIFFKNIILDQMNKMSEIQNSDKSLPF